MRLFSLMTLSIFFISSTFADENKINTLQEPKLEWSTVRRPCAQVGPKGTNIPSPLKKPIDITPLSCDRPFIYRGEMYSTDAPQAQDASNLKSFVESVPEAASILEEYQENRTRSKISAYTGTLGILMLVLANPIAKQFSADSQQSVRTALRVGGLAIAAGSFFYSFTLLKTNEYLIPKSVDTYNKAKPKDPIELQFTTGWTF